MSNRSGRARKRIGRPAPFPTALAPQLATLAKRAPEGEGWVHEVKYDGYRMLARVDRGDVRLVSRHARDWTRRFPAIARAFARLGLRSAWVDGEIVAVDGEGRISFQELQAAVHRGETVPLLYFAFDLPYLDGRDLRDEPLLARKAVLEPLATRASDAIRYSRHYAGNGSDYFRGACELRLEGIVSKLVDSRYAAGRSTAWLKTKCGLREPFVVGGYTRSPAGLESLLLGAYDERGRLVYAGRVKRGLHSRIERTLARRLGRIARKTPAFAERPPVDAQWVSPRLVADVAFLERTRSGALRHASFAGLAEADPRAVTIKPHAQL